MLLLIAVPCFVTLPVSLSQYDQQTLGSGADELPPRAPSWSEPLGSDRLGRPLHWRLLLGGAISLGVGLCAATIAVSIGVTWGALAGYRGGRTDAAMMRFVDVLYGLPYVLLVVLLSVAVDGLAGRARDAEAAGEPWPVVGGLLTQDPVWVNLVTLVVAIGAVSWLTMSRVIRGQVLSLRAQPFIEACRAQGIGPWRTLRVHLLPNLVGPIVVYATLTVPMAILQESFLSFLAIGVKDPLPSWGKLAAEGVRELPAVTLGLDQMDWWLLVYPCLLLGLTLMALNFLGDALRDRYDPKRGDR